MLTAADARKLVEQAVGQAVQKATSITSAEREAQQASESKVQAGFSILATGIGALFGRKTISATNIGKAASAARSVSRTMKESGDVGRAQDTVRSVQAQIEELDAQLRADLAGVEAASDPSQKPLDAVSIKPKKTNIAVQLCTLVWAPYWKDAQGTITPALE